MRSLRNARPLVAAWMLTGLLTLVNVAVALADSGGSPFPK